MEAPLAVAERAQFVWTEVGGEGDERHDERGRADGDGLAQARVVEVDPQAQPHAVAQERGHLHEDLREHAERAAHGEREQGEARVRVREQAVGEE